MRALSKGDITDDYELEMVQMWINKLLRTLHKEFDERDEFNRDSDSELVETTFNDTMRCCDILKQE